MNYKSFSVLTLFRYVGLPEEWRSYNKQFGVPLSDLPKVKVDGYSGRWNVILYHMSLIYCSIPTVLVMLHRLFVAMSGSSVMGIFRLAPDKDQCQVLSNFVYIYIAV